MTKLRDIDYAGHTSTDPDSASHALDDVRAAIANERRLAWEWNQLRGHRGWRHIPGWLWWLIAVDMAVCLGATIWALHP